jgi:hypothetical protein
METPQRDFERVIVIATGTPKGADQVANLGQGCFVPLVTTIGATEPFRAFSEPLPSPSFWLNHAD